MSASNSQEYDALEQQIRTSFEVSLSTRVKRASGIELQNVIPSHWFSAAASECGSMYIAGYFYGSIFIAQAYVEALSKFLNEHHKIGAKNDPIMRWKRLNERGFVSDSAYNAASLVFDERNEFHHLNKDIEQCYQKLEGRAKECVNHLQTIEAEIFGYSFDNGKIVLLNPEYWPENSPGMTLVHLRQKW